MNTKIQTKILKNHGINLKKFSSLKNEKKIKDLLTSRKSLISLAISFPETSENLVTSAIVNSVYDRLRKEEDGEDD